MTRECQSLVTHYDSTKREGQSDPLMIRLARKNMYLLGVFIFVRQKECTFVVPEPHYTHDGKWVIYDPCNDEEVISDTQEGLIEKFISLGRAMQYNPMNYQV